MERGATNVLVVDGELAGEGLGEPRGFEATLARLNLSQVPWWIVSVSFHLLGILFLTLITWSTYQPEDETTIITSTLERSTYIQNDLNSIKVDSPEVLISDSERMPRNAADQGAPIFVSPNLKDQAIEGDHWETINLNMPDSKSARGDPDSHTFYLPSGDDQGERGEGGTDGEPLDEVIGTGSGTQGWSGNGRTGIGTDSGNGRTSFGIRGKGGRQVMIMRTGGGGTPPSVDLALAWLAQHQESDGRWDTMKYESSVKTDTAVTGMALLAFLGAGHTEKVGPYKDNVRHAVAWLRSKQQADGLVFDPTDAGNHRGTGYPHAIAGMALAEAAGMARVPETIAAAQRAVDYSIQKQQSGEGYDRLGFRYNAKQAGDLSVTGWYVMQLKSAKLAGLKVETSAFEGIIRFLDSVERKGAGGDKGYGPSSVYSYQPNDPHESTAHRLTMIGNLCRQFLGWKKNDLRNSIEWAVEKGGLPDGWGEGKTDLYYWYYGSLCTFQQQGDVWNRWNSAMKKTFLESQRKGGDEKGSWDAVGDFSKEWGRVGQTALSCMCIEVYYRYALVYK